MNGGNAPWREGESFSILDREREREENFILFHSLDKKGQSEEGFVVTRFISFRIFNFYWIRL